MESQKSEIKVTRTQNPKIGSVDWDKLPFGRVFSDHMLIMNYSDGGWGTPEIKEFGALSMHPATSAIHYG